MADQGFLAPALDAQRVFRTLLAALAEPGRVFAIDPGCTPPDGIDPAAAAMVLTLCDGDTPLWLAPSMQAATDYFRFHTGAPIVSAPEDALFLVAGAAERPPLASLHEGTLEYPDRSATLLLAVSTLDEDQGWRLSGPGIAGSRAFQVQPLDKRFPTEWRDNHAGFPLGVDALFAARDRIAGLPRSTRLEV